MKLTYELIHEELVKDSSQRQTRAEVFQLYVDGVAALQWWLVELPDGRFICFHDKAYVHYWLRGWKITGVVISPASYAMMTDHIDEGSPVDLLAMSTMMLPAFEGATGEREWGKNQCPACYRTGTLEFLDVEPIANPEVVAPFRCNACGKRGAEHWKMTFDRIVYEDEEDGEPLAGRRYTHYKGGEYRVRGVARVQMLTEEQMTPAALVCTAIDTFTGMERAVFDVDGQLTVHSAYRAHWDYRYVVYHDTRTKGDYLRELSEWNRPTDAGETRFSLQERG